MTASRGSTQIAQRTVRSRPLMHTSLLFYSDVGLKPAIETVLSDSQRLNTYSWKTIGPTDLADTFHSRVGVTIWALPGNAATRRHTGEGHKVVQLRAEPAGELVQVDCAENLRSGHRLEVGHCLIFHQGIE